MVEPLRQSFNHPIDAFLAGAERRAWLHARLAVRDDQAALDIVQDAMTRLVEHYADRSTQEWPLLFQRILQNAILDHFRRKKVRDTWTILVSNLLPGKRGQDETETDDALLERLAGEDGYASSAEDEAAQRQGLARIAEALAELPLRQRQAFLLRYWEGHDLSETAKAMGCSEGSVKTHASRACHALARVLGGRDAAGSWKADQQSGSEEGVADEGTDE
jgi:RNA polymerase sigma-70 factor (ECF subfamily)